MADAVRFVLFTEPTEPTLTRERYEVLERRAFWRLGVPASIALGIAWRLWREAHLAACLAPFVGMCVALWPRTRPGEFDDLDARAAAFANACACVAFALAVACDASMGVLVLACFVAAKPWTLDPASLVMPISLSAVFFVPAVVQCLSVVSSIPFAHLALRRPAREVARASVFAACIVFSRAAS